MKKQFLFIAIALSSLVAQSQDSILAEEAINHIGKTLTVCGKVSGGRYLNNFTTKPTLLNVGGEFPNHSLTILIRNEDRKNFPYKPEEEFANRNVCVTGKLIEYRGKPELIVSTPSEIVLRPENPADKELTALETSKTRNTSTKDKSSASPASPTRGTTSRREDIPSTVSKSEESAYTIELGSSINLREGPSLEDEVIALLKAGTSVKIFKSANGWSYVSVLSDNKSKTMYGYIKNSVLK